MSPHHESIRTGLRNGTLDINSMLGIVKTQTNDTDRWKQKSMKLKGTLAPPANSIHRFDGNGHPIYLPPWMSDYLNINFIVPLIAFVVIVVGILVICVALTRRRMDPRNGPKDVYCRFSFSNLSHDHWRIQCSLSFNEIKKNTTKKKL